MLPSFRSSVAHGSTLEEAHDFVWRRVSRGRRRGDFTVFLFSASASDETAVPFRRPPSLFISLAVSMADCFSFSSSSPFFFYSVSRERERERECTEFSPFGYLVLLGFLSFADSFRPVHVIFVFLERNCQFGLFTFVSLFFTEFSILQGVMDVNLF